MLKNYNVTDQINRNSLNRQCRSSALWVFFVITVLKKVSEENISGGGLKFLDSKFIFLINTTEYDNMLISNLK